MSYVPYSVQIIHLFLDLYNWAKWIVHFFDHMQFNAVLLHSQICQDTVSRRNKSKQFNDLLNYAKWIVHFIELFLNYILVRSSECQANELKKRTNFNWIKNNIRFIDLFNSTTIWDSIQNRIWIGFCLCWSKIVVFHFKRILYLYQNRENRKIYDRI